MSTLTRRNILPRALGVALIAIVVVIPESAVHARGTAVKAGGTVTITYGPHGSFTRNFNPLAANPADGTTAFIYEPLLMFNQLSGKTVPWLATSYKWSNGNKRLTFNLRSGVKWNDGKPFTSADVKFSLTLAKNPAIPCGDCWKAISSISTPTKTTVVFNLKTVNTSMLYYIGQFYQVPQHVFAKAGDPVKFTNPNPVGTGPFKLSSFTPQVYTLTKNKYFWQKGKPYVSALRFPAFTGNDSAQLAAVNGELDWAGILIPDAQKVYASKSSNNHFWYAGVGGPVGLCLNNAQAPFNNVHVRRAVSYAVDRQTVAKVAEYGYAPPANQAFVQPQFLKKWANPAAVKMVASTANIAKAKAELAKAGKVNYTKSLKLNVVNGFSDWQTGAQILQNNLKAAGFNVTVQALEYGAYFSDLQLGKYDMSYCGPSTGPNPYYLYQGTFASKGSAPIGQTAASNFSRYSNPKVDSLLASYTKTTSSSKQVAIIKQVESIVAADVPMVPVFVGDYWDNYSTKRFTGWPSASHPYDFGAPYQNPSNEDVILHIRPR
ncbi:MAG: ABC transporter substrate-binding protein [Chloroflexota bacterium]